MFLFYLVEIQVYKGEKDYCGTIDEENWVQRLLIAIANSFETKYFQRKAKKIDPMKLKYLMILLLATGMVFTSCEKDEEALFENNLQPDNKKDNTTEEFGDIEVEQFVYKGMNDIYLYKADVPVLADDYFATTTEKNGYLAEFNSPESLFDNLLSSQDRFSFITDDYVALEERFKGINSSIAGMEFGLGRITDTNNIFGFLQYVLPNTSADEAGLTRGTVFTEVNGTKLTINNYADLMQGSFTINVGRVENGTLILTGETVTLNSDGYTENPVFIAKTLDVEGKTVGYLMYNSFIADFDDELNTAFGEFKAAGVTDLVLDLRYNGGGSVESAVDLASMITGQFEGQIFMKEQWNEKYQKYFEAENPESLLNRFNAQIRTQEAINSLQLSKVYILTTSGTASASELVINGLDPYIDVVQVGTTTTGKFQASATLYDSPDFGKDGANENHTYAIQPLIFKSANSVGKTDYVDGLLPDIELAEDLNDLGTLGDPSEPLLQAALNHMLGKAQQTKSQAARKAAEKFETVGQGDMHQPTFQRMYVDELPPVLNRN